MMNSENNNDVTGLILAGGKGTRISALYPDIPKPMIPVKGKPFLYWVVQWLTQQGITRIIISTGHMAKKIDEWVASRPFPDNIEILCRKELEPLGTGGGIRNCLDLLGEWTLVTNGDSLIAADIADQIAGSQSADLDSFIFGISVSDTSRFGSLRVGSDGNLIEFAEKVPGSGLINGGLYLLRKSVIASIQPNTMISIERDIFPNLLAGGSKIGIISIKNFGFLDIGTPESLVLSDSFVAQSFSVN
jgi:D-glycero-alpha-D-manno-heptose 1-phosphate guanylyltransferase